MRPRRGGWQSAGPRWTRSPSGSAVVVIDGPVDPAEVLQVCAGLRAGLPGARSVVCRGEALADPDLTTVDLLAQLVLFAGQTGTAVHMQTPLRLRELVRFVGLDGCLAGCWSAVEPVGESEQREQAVGVEERVEPDDNPV